MTTGASIAFDRRATIAAMFGAIAARGAIAEVDRAQGPTVRPEDFGAAGNGIADDTEALRRFLRSPAGTHALTARRTYRLVPRPQDGENALLPLERGVRLVGNGAVLRLTDGSTGYGSILGSTQSDLTGLSISGVTFDHNVMRGAPVRVRNGLLTESRSSVYIKRASSFEFTDNLVCNAASTNSVVYSGDGATRNCTVARNRFEMIGDTPNHAYHDHSTLYLTGDGITVRDNVFQSAFFGAGGSVCAIEVHPGAGCTISGNEVHGFHTGINYAGIYEEDSRDGRIVGNILDVLRRGIAIYAGAYNGHITGYSINGLAIDDNRIRIRNGRTRGAMSGGGPGCTGIGFAPGTTLPVSDVTISGTNQILFDLESAQPDWDAVPVAVGIVEGAGRGHYRRVRIGSVGIVNAPGIGIAMGIGGGLLEDCSVDHPRLMRPGSTASHTFPSIYRAALWLNPGEIRGSLRVRRAEIVDDLPDCRLENGFAVGVAGGAGRGVLEIDGDLSLSGNRSAFKRTVLHLDDRIVPKVEISQNFPFNRQPGARFAAGSIVRDRQTGRAYSLDV